MSVGEGERSGLHPSETTSDRNSTLEQYEQLATASGARCHAYSPPPPPPPPPSCDNSEKNPLLFSFSSSQSASGRSISSTNSVLLGPVPTLLPNEEDVLSVVTETEVVRDTLAKIQALSLEGCMEGHTPTPTEQELDEESLTSQQWLEIHGIKAKKLRYENMVDTLTFQHCNGIVQVPVPKYQKKKNGTETIEVIPHSRIVHAQYCKDFVHVRCNSEKTVHVQLTDRAYKTYQNKVKSVIAKCDKRLTWLKEGSRELFGTLLESKVVVVIDTSSSVKGRLGLIKDKVQQLLQEQLSHKKEFTLIHFNSEVHCWRASLVPTSPQNLDAVSQWVQGLLAEGSTNTLGVLEVAMSISEAEGVYLLTDGRPDQPLDGILARVQQLPRIPIHTISFNCVDSKVNHFLSKLSSNTRGRYHYYSEDTTDPEGPTAYQSEDIQKLEEEIEYAKKQLELGSHLLMECNVVRRRRNKRGRRLSWEQRQSVTASAPGRNKSANRKIKKYKLSSKKWLEKKSLSALNLTLMDAFGPASTPHTSKHVPLLGKDISSKVFTSIFPLVHVTNGNEVTLINPNGVNLKDYEEQLDNQVGIYWDRLTHIAWVALSDDGRYSLAVECGMDEGGEPKIPSYRDHRDKVQRSLEDSGWPRPKEDFDLLEKEIGLANNFKKYLKAFKTELEKSRHKMTTQRRGSQSSLLISDCRESTNNEDKSEVVGLYSPLSSVPWMDHLLHGSLPSQHHQTRTLSPSSSRYNGSPSHRRHLKGQHVIVRSDEDGFYYPGLVVDEPDKMSVIVKLMDQQKVAASLTRIIPVGGARPCPMLNIGDHVLVRVRTHNGPHPSTADGSCDYYIPGIIQALPEDKRKGHALYSMIVYNERCVTSSRRGIVKISRTIYTGICTTIKSSPHLPPTPSRLEVSSAAAAGGKSHDRLDSRQNIIRIPHSSYDNEIEETQSQSESKMWHRSGSKILSHSGSKTRSCSGSKIQSHSGSRRLLVQEQGRGGGGGGGGGGERSLADISEVMEWVVEQQRVQREALEEQKGKISSIQLHQNQLKEANKKLEDSRSEQVVGGGGSASSRGGQPPAPVRAVMVETSTTTDISFHSNGSLSPSNVHPLVGRSEQAVNTDVWTEDRGMGTDPMTESCGVGTEWNESETESELDSDNSSDGVSTSPQDNTANLDRSHDHSTPVSRYHTPNHTPNHTSNTLSMPPLHSSPHHPVMVTTPIDPNIPSQCFSSEEGDPLVNQYALARWPDDGWYYRGLIVCPIGQMWYQVKDASHDMEKIHALDIIIDQQDAMAPLQVGDTVVALHPNYGFSYAPGKITGVVSDGIHFSVELYDGTRNFVRREDIYRLAQAKYLKDVEYLRMKEKAWVGQSVVARRDSDGLYLPGEVVEQSGLCQYLIRWTDGKSQVQEVIHMYGSLTKKRGFYINDHVLALAVQSKGIYMPGTIQEKVGQELLVQFCDGQNSPVNPVQCFWLSSEYYQEAVEFIATNVTPSSSSQLSLSTLELSDRYDPPFQC